ncbi:MAG: type II toxin-antitoxin system Phd/YefM family antitoxin [Acidobacteria bacterium]|nr:type II toxin-antitoxin system Phd/YefM family antitoxin [Acidobacteriota bacterium]
MVAHYGTMRVMEVITISKFKGNCFAILERVRKTRKPVLVTRFGKPIAELAPPPSPLQRPARWLGLLADTGRIKGDIVSPAGHEDGGTPTSPTP